MLRQKIVSTLLLCLACLGSVYAAPSAIKIDQIVAVVNDDVITRRELEERLSIVVQQLKKQGTPLPAPEALEKQILERMVLDMLQTQFAKETGVRVDDTQLDKTLQHIAQDNGFPSLEAFRDKLAEEGVDFKKFREEMRNEITSTRLREREVDSRLVVSDSEVENYLATQAKQSGRGEEYQLAHILVVVPEQASASVIQERKQRAEAALAQLRNGAEFAQVAAGFSDAKDALQGGNLGWRAAERIPSIFGEELEKMHIGDTSRVLRSANGFHILRLLDKRDLDVPLVVTQTHARHILIKTSELVSENTAKARLLEIKQRVDAGADFAELARQFSNDGSAPQGGDLGWISPGETVPEFESALTKLHDGQVSLPVQSGFGWHLIQVLERRSADVSGEQKRQQARMAIRANKSDEAFQDWLRQLRDRAFVEYRLSADGDK